MFGFCCSYLPPSVTVFSKEDVLLVYLKFCQGVKTRTGRVFLSWLAEDDVYSVMMRYRRPIMEGQITIDKKLLQGERSGYGGRRKPAEVTRGKEQNRKRKHDSHPRF